MRRRLGIDAFDPLDGTVATDGSGVVAPGLAQAACLTSRGGSCPTLALPGESALGDVHDPGVVTGNEFNSFPIQEVQDVIMQESIGELRGAGEDVL